MPLYNFPLHSTYGIYIFCTPFFCAVCPTKSRSRKAVPLAIPPWAIALILLLILLLLGILALVLLKLLLMLLVSVPCHQFDKFRYEKLETKPH